MSPHKSQYSLEKHRPISLIGTCFFICRPQNFLCSTAPNLTSLISHPNFPSPARRASDSPSVLDVCLCRFMNPVHLTNFWERHATIQQKPKAMLEYLLRLVLVQFWLYIFLVPFGCSVVIIDGTMMPLSCVLHMAHLLPWEAAPGKTAGSGERGRHCSS